MLLKVKIFYIMGHLAMIVYSGLLESIYPLQTFHGDLYHNKLELGSFCIRFKHVEKKLLW